MEYVQLNNSVKMPMIGFGSSEVLEVEGITAIVSALNNGYRHIDTAEGYGNEADVGKAIRQSGVNRSDIFITTKIDNPRQKTGDIEKAFEESLEKLGLDYVDLYLIHWPIPDKFVETWLTFEKIYKNGKAKAIGVSNFKEHHLDAIKNVWTVVPAVNQYEHHPYLTQKSILEYCKKEGIVVTAYSPLGRASNDLLSNPVIQVIAKKYNKTSAQIILRWNIQLGVVAIPRSVKPERIKENISIFDFELSQEDIASLNELDSGSRVIIDPDEIE